MRKLQSLLTETIPNKHVYPFLFALYPSLFLYLRNIHEVLPARLFPVLGVSLVIAIVFWLLTRIATRQHGKRSLLLFLFLLLFHSYGLYYELIAGLLPYDSQPLLSYAIAFILPGGLWFFLSWAIVRSKKSFATLNRILQLVVIFLLLWNLMGILIYHGRLFFGQDQLQHRPPPFLKKNPQNQTNRPDIYCFILDEFASLESARSLFRYDNSIFAETLRQQGFFVAQNSRTIFQMTEQAIAAILNLGEFNEKKDPYQLIRKNTVAAFMKQQGYRISEFPIQPSSSMEAADQRFYYSLTRVSIFFDDFYRLLCERSLLHFLTDHWLRDAPNASRYFRERVLQVFEKLPEVIKGPGPKFVFIHLYCPHEPFVFDEQGETVPSTHFWDHADPRYYLQQYKFISRKMVETAAMILEESPTPPVIIIQSDHGYRGSRGRLPLGRQVDWNEKFKVFNALYLPGIDLKKIDPSLSPLNNFRLIFNYYFGEHYPLARNP